MSKKSRSEGNRVASLIKANKTQYYIADVDLEDNPDDVINSVKCVVKTLGKVKAAFMVISAGVKVLTVVSYVPSELDLDKDEWINESIKNLGGEPKIEQDDNYTVVTIEIDTPFKLKDIVRGNGFGYLTKKGLMGDEESSEEFVGFDDM